MTKGRWTMLAGGVAALALAAGCNKGGGTYQPKPVAKKELQKIDPNLGAKIWPLEVGNSWTYNVVTESAVQVAGGGRSSKNSVLTFSVAKVTPGANGTVVLLEQWDGDVRPEKPGQQQWLVNDTGIYQQWIGNPAQAYSPMQPAIFFPLEPNATKKTKCVGPVPVGGMGSQESEITLLQAQFVDTDMGSMTGMPVQTTATWKGKTKDDKGKEVAISGVLVSTSYFSPNVGLVRFTQETRFGSVVAVQKLTLKSYIVK